MFDLSKAIADWRKQMVAGGIKGEALDELECHLRDDFEQMSRSGISCAKAFEAAMKQIGPPAELRKDFKKTSTLMGYSHERTYSALLIVLAVYSTITASGLLMFLAMPHRPSTADIGMHLPDWSLSPLMALNFVYAMAMMATLIARRYRPDLGHQLTRLLNCALLLALPCGTILGIYGLWKVDRKKEQYA